MVSNGIVQIMSQRLESWHVMTGPGGSLTSATGVIV